MKNDLAPWRIGGQCTRKAEGKEVLRLVVPAPPKQRRRRCASALGGSALQSPAHRWLRILEKLGVLVAERGCAHVRQADAALRRRAAGEADGSAAWREAAQPPGGPAWRQHPDQRTETPCNPAHALEDEYPKMLQHCGWKSAAVITSVRSSMLRGP